MGGEHAVLELRRAEKAKKAEAEYRRKLNLRTVYDGYLKKHNIITYPLSWEAYHNEVWTHANSPEKVDLVLTKLVLNGENVDTSKLPTLCLSVLNKGSYVYN